VDREEKNVKHDDQITDEKMFVRQTYSQEITGVIPTASEMESYKKTDVDIIKFIIKDAEIRRDETIKANNRQFDLIEKEQHNKQILNKIALILGAIISVFIISCAVYLSRSGDYVTSGIIAGTNISLIIASYSSFLKK
jgi:hypothetical protein